MALLVRHALGSESRDEFEAIRAMVDADPASYVASAADPAGRAASGMIRSALRHLDAIGRMEMIEGGHDPLAGDCANWAA
ncbi:hypothetical protein V8J36_10870 [Frigidibacter sp. MR17.14]